MATRPLQIFGSVAVAMGLTLLIVNVAGLCLGPKEHSKAALTTIHKIGLQRLSYEEAIRTLDNVDPNLSTEQRLRRINEIIAARVVHLWPGPGTTDPEVMHSISENWYMAALQGMESWLAARGLSDIYIARIERRDYRSILAKGVGYCSSASLAVVDYLRGQGVSAKMLPLGGHVIAIAYAGQKTFLLDPDYNVVVSAVPEPPARSIPQITRAYREAGYPPEVVTVLEGVYSRSKMVPREIEDYTRGWRRSIIRARLIKWIVPAVLLSLGIALLWRTRTRGP